MTFYRKIIFLSMLVLFMFSSHAQVRRWSYFGFTAGVSFPMGDFGTAQTGSFNNWNNRAGFASTGFTLGAEGAYYFLPKLALAGSLYLSDHGGLSKKDVSILGASYTDAFGVDASTVRAGRRYSAVNLMVGPQFSIPVNKLTIDLRFLAGVIKSLSTPEVTVQLEDDADHPFRQMSSKASAFGWQAGAGIRYALTGGLGLMVKADYFNCSGVKVENENRVNDAGRLVTKQPMAWLNINGGVYFALGGK